MIRDDSFSPQPHVPTPGEDPGGAAVPENRPTPRWAEQTLYDSFESHPVTSEPVLDEEMLAPDGMTPLASEVPIDTGGGLHLGSVLRETLETIVLALLIFITVRAIVQNFKVEGSSMEPNLHTGQYLLVNKASYLTLNLTSLENYMPQLVRPAGEATVSPFGEPERGDVIVFRYPRDPRRDFIKRIIGVPGDTVVIREGRVVVNGQALAEPYLGEPTGYSREPTTVPPGFYYVLGDNRNNSSDSHVWGPVPRENIIGKAWLSYWPLSDWGLAPNFSVAAGN